MFDPRKEGNVLFNDALNTFYLRLYGVGHMVKDHSDSERGNLLPPHGPLQWRRKMPKSVGGGGGGGTETRDLSTFGKEPI